MEIRSPVQASPEPRGHKLTARAFLIGAGVGILLGIIIGFVIGVHVAETTLVIPLGDGIEA